MGGLQARLFKFEVEFKISIFMHGTWVGAEVPDGSGGSITALGAEIGSYFIFVLQARGLPVARESFKISTLLIFSVEPVLNEKFICCQYTL